ncbi:MAG: hypothetical protein FWC97_05275 [Treponema sp.]|nr:hypothetical protein [Treponema sp.]
MLGKLMKYEFIAMGRVFLPLFGALLTFAAINRLLTRLPNTTPAAISIIVVSVLIGAIIVVTLILTIQRFRKNLLAEEGYLMMTLPVKTDHLILSKLFVATIFNFASVIVVVQAILILTPFDFAGFFAAENWFPIATNRYTYFFTSFELGLIFVKTLLVVILSTFSSILLLYTCMALSLFVNSRRGLFAFGAFIVITTVMQILGGIFTSIFFSSGIYRYVDRLMFEMNLFAETQLIMLTIIAVLLGVCAVFYFTTRYMLKRRLNLQ